MKYVKNREFIDLLIKYKQTKDNKIYNNIGKIFMLIALNLLNKSNLINYTQDRKDEMVSEAVFDMCRYVNVFNPNRSDNPFAYFTRCAYNAFNRYFNNHKKYNDIFNNVSYVENFDNNLK